MRAASYPIAENALRRRVRRLSRLLAAGIAVACAAPALGAQYPGLPPPPPCGPVRSVPAAAPAAPAERTLGVVYFQNTAPAEADAYLGEALTHRVIDRLRALQSVRVVPTRRYGYDQLLAPGGARDIGRTIGVRYVLSATVMREPRAAEVTVRARIFRTADGALVWAGSRSAPLGTLPAVEEYLAAAADSTAGAPRSARLAPAAVGRPSAAYAHFLRGEYLHGLHTEAGYRAAAAQYDSAVRADPTFDAALTRLALADASVLRWGWWNLDAVSRRALVAQGDAAAERALRLAPRSGAAWAARGAMILARDPAAWETAARALRTAVDRDAHSAVALRWYGRALFEAGDDAGARRALDRAVALDPEDALSLYELARIARVQGDPRSACALLDSAIAVDPTTAAPYALRALVRAQFGQLRYAWADAEIAGRLGWPGWGDAATAVVDVMARDSASARALTKEMLARRDAMWTGEYLPIALVVSGNRDAALRVLRDARVHGALPPAALRAPELQPLRGTAAFRRLLAQSGATAPPGR